MAVSKKRKKAGKVVRRQQVVLPQREHEFPDRWDFKIKASQMFYLKNDPDFLLMIKIGRMLNAVTFALTIFASFEKLASKVGFRQTRRGLFVLAGYVHESISIIKNVEERHVTMESFVPLRDIAYNHEYRKARDYARTIRNVTAFHLDESTTFENTKRSLEDLELGAHGLMGGDNLNPGTFYFELADYLDFALIGRTFQDGREPQETANDIQKTILEVGNELVNRGHAFMLALARKMELGEYVHVNLSGKFAGSVKLADDTENNAE